MAKGTQRIEVQGIVYETPPIPNIKDIRGSDRKKSDQVWRRREEYLQWTWNTDPKEGDLWHVNPAEGQMEWYEEEIKRINYGDWIMINGVPTYFNKWCYFFHQWFVLLEGIHPHYKDTSLEYYQFFDHCYTDRFTLGDIGVKGRRLGLSSMSASIKLQIGILESNTLQGIVSKTGVDAQEMYFMVKNGLENLPPFLMPDLNKVTESEIHIAKPSKKISTNNTKASADKGRNNRINWLDTAENAYDGRPIKHVTVDEAAKWERVNVQICISKITETLVKGAVIKGHMSVFSTVNKGDKGGDNFKALYLASDHIEGKKDRFGCTATRLKRFFIPGFRGFWGYVDQFGNSVVDTPTKEQTAYLKTVIDPETGDLACPDPTIGAKEYLTELRKMKETDSDDYAEQVRKYPFEWKEVFKGTSTQCHFNVDDLNDQIEKVEDQIRELGRNPEKQENGRKGIFKKGDNGKVYWKDTNEGLWHILEFLDEGESNRHVFNGSIKCPDNTGYGVAGLDTFSNARATVDKGSDACCVIFKRYNPLNPANSGMPIAFFIGRPKTKIDFHNQIFLALEYYGIRMLAERAPTDWEDYATDESRRLASPLDQKKKHGYLITTKRADDSEVYGIAPQDTQARETHLTEMIEYALNNMHKIKFIRILKDMLKFNIKERTDFDGAMAFGYALMGLKEKAKPIKSNNTSGMKFLKTFRLG